ncbi:hypothetical protein C8R43DRAFT_1133706 [Mycena crocata]|nr:hypothetical protein C8R43DRAFT_1133706 [Mycena crocata]
MMYPLLIVLAVAVFADAADDRNFECPLEDTTHNYLIGSGISGDFLSCTYSGAGQCAYSMDGYFFTGSTTCPDALSAVTDKNDLHVASSTICPKKDDAGSNLVGSGVGGKFKSCTYTDAGLCIYSSVRRYFSASGNDGLFSSGGSTCPDTIIPSSLDCSVVGSNTSPKGVTPQGDAVLAASSAGASDEGGGNKVRPELIALIVLNGVFALVIIGLVVMLVRARRVAARSVHHSALYTGIDDPRPSFTSPSHTPKYYSDGGDKDSASVPLTQGLAIGEYHDTQ